MMCMAYIAYCISAQPTVYQRSRSKDVEAPTVIQSSGLTFRGPVR